MFSIASILKAANELSIPLTFSQAFSKAFGNDTLQKRILAGPMLNNYNELIDVDLTLFYKKAKPCFFYKQMQYYN
ncbi:hypothetical protein EKK58_07145 [Candidatus Dependentiae bacterium]|nr:MAG: hypothetical protein EKK58_07145 [Candidatus Dependentiae bacterium]